MPDLPDCSGRVALVTGASRGIGAAIADRLAAAGAAVAVTARTLDESPGANLGGSLRATVAGIEAHGVAGFAVAADLADPVDRARIVPAVAAALGPVDILVNNAAAAIYAPVAEMPLRRRELLFEVDVHAPVDLVQAVLPGMVAARCRVDRQHLERDVGAPGAVRRTPRSRWARPRLPTARPRPRSSASPPGWPRRCSQAGVVVNALAPVTGVLTEGAAVVMAGRVDTSGFEPVEHMAEAAAYLATCRWRSAPAGWCRAGRCSGRSAALP